MDGGKFVKSKLGINVPEVSFILILGAKRLKSFLRSIFKITHVSS
jgi:excinuclease UvrABC helicase subunit UvrB